MESTPKAAPAATDSASQERSTIQFPYLDLDAAGHTSGDIALTIKKEPGAENSE